MAKRKGKRASNWTAITLIAAAAAITGLGLGELAYIGNSAGHLLGMAEVVDRKLDRGDWEAAQDELGRLRRQWVKTASRWTLFLNHREIDEINMSVAKAEGFAEARDKTMLSSELLTIKQLVRHIPDLEKVSLNNIF